MVNHASSVRKIPVHDFVVHFLMIREECVNAYSISMRARLRLDGLMPGMPNQREIRTISSDSERVGHPVEEREQGDDVNGFGDLRFRPALSAQGLGIVGRHPGRVHSELAGVFQKGCLRAGQTWQGCVQIAGGQGSDEFVVGLLRPQEACVRICSVVALVQG